MDKAESFEMRRWRRRLRATDRGGGSDREAMCVFSHSERTNARMNFSSCFRKISDGAEALSCGRDGLLLLE
jgi:hypothetical protein